MCNEETSLVISGQIIRFIECNDETLSEHILLNVFRHETPLNSVQITEYIW